MYLVRHLRSIPCRGVHARKPVRIETTQLVCQSPSPAARQRTAASAKVTMTSATSSLALLCFVCAYRLELFVYNLSPKRRSSREGSSREVVKDGRVVKSGPVCLDDLSFAALLTTSSGVEAFIRCMHVSERAHAVVLVCQLACLYVCARACMCSCARESVREFKSSPIVFARRAESPSSGLPVWEPQQRGHAFPAVAAAIEVKQHACSVLLCLGELGSCQLGLGWRPLECWTISLSTQQRICFREVPCVAAFWRPQHLPTHHVRTY